MTNCEDSCKVDVKEQDSVLRSKIKNHEFVCDKVLHNSELETEIGKLCYWKP